MAQARTYRAIGLMSGTSLDGIDAALIETDGAAHVVRRAFIGTPYAPDIRDSLRAVLNRPRNEATRVEAQLTRAHADIVADLLMQQNLTPADIDVIGFHGQTIGHDPARGYTCQIGDGKLLAALTGIAVVNDFRTADVAAGGQGAPLAPVYHRVLAAAQDKPVAVLNIGGVANVTYIDAAGDMLAFDTGPGNALVDDWVLQHTGKKFDADGALARAGTVDENILAVLLSHRFFDVMPPKSLDRNDFVSPVWAGLDVADGAATLTAFTVGAIVKSCAHMPQKPATWIVSGGGRLNGFMMDSLARALDARVISIDETGFNGDAVEAEAFAYMAVRHLERQPISFPGTTGVKMPMQGGVYHVATRKDVA